MAEEAADGVELAMPAKREPALGQTNQRPPQESEARRQPRPRRQLSDSWMSAAARHHEPAVLVRRFACQDLVVPMNERSSIDWGDCGWKMRRGTAVVVLARRVGKGQGTRNVSREGESMIGTFVLPTITRETWIAPVLTVLAMIVASQTTIELGTAVATAVASNGRALQSKHATGSASTTGSEIEVEIESRSWVESTVETAKERERTRNETGRERGVGILRRSLIDDDQALRAGTDVAGRVAVLVVWRLVQRQYSVIYWAAAAYQRPNPCAGEYVHAKAVARQDFLAAPSSFYRGCMVPMVGRWW